MKITSVRMTPANEEALNQIARDMRSFTTSGNPSWRVMLLQIAAGNLRVKNPAIIELYVNFLKPPRWWTPDADGAMPAAFVAGKYRASVDELVDKGFLPISGDRLKGDWKAWKKKPEPPVANPPATDGPLIDPSTLPEPPWFRRSPNGSPTMLLADAVEASGESANELESGGIRIMKHGGLSLVTGPVGSTWDFDAFQPSVGGGEPKK